MNVLYDGVNTNTATMSASMSMLNGTNFFLLKTCMLLFLVYKSMKKNGFLFFLFLTTRESMHLYTHTHTRTSCLYIVNVDLFLHAVFFPTGIYIIPVYIFECKRIAYVFCINFRK